MKSMSVYSFAADLLSTTVFWTSDECPFRIKLTKAEPKALVIAGSNASGKSLFCQHLAGWAHQSKVLPVSVSIRERTGAGSGDMSGMRRVMMFGSEDMQSTGATSVRVAQTGFHNVLERKAMLILDEPDMGLSEDYAHAFGRLIAREHAAALAKNADYVGLVLVTHSKSLVKGLYEEGLNPSFASAGEAYTLPQWLDAAHPRTLEELLSLSEVALSRRRATLALLNEKD